MLFRLVLRIWRWRSETAPERQGDKIRKDVATGDEKAVNEDVQKAIRK